MPTRFDHYVIVDWSAASRPKQGGDSIWICHKDRDGERCENPPTRHVAKALLGDILAAASARGERVLLGFDFPFGYPAGFAARLGLSGPPWRAVWDEIDTLLQDRENNENNRFTVAAAFNRRISGATFPFWGCPSGFKSDHLAMKHHRGHTAGGLQEKRLIDEHMVGAQPCWKLAGTGSVGGQALTGIKVVRELRDDPRWRGAACVWPFETGLRPPAEPSIVFAEVWPSWWDWKATRRADDPCNDMAQVRHVANVFADLAHAGGLADLFRGAPELTAEERHRVETEEAWTLGVVVSRSRARCP